MTTNPLDQEFCLELSSRLQVGEEILWTGNPDLEKLEQLEPSTFENLMDVLENLQFIAIIFILFIAALYSNAGWGTFVIILLGYIGIQFLHNTWNKSNPNTVKYAYSNQRIFFKIWKKKKSEIYCIDLNKVAKISFEIEPVDIGTLHFMTQIDLGLTTVDLITGEERHHPTFELQSNVIDLRENIEKIRRRRNISLTGN